MTGALGMGLVSGLAAAGALVAAGGDGKQAMTGWLLAFANGAAGWFIDLKMVGRAGERSVLMGLAAHAVRAMALLLVVAFVRLRFGHECEAFVAATLVAYFVFLFGEIARLARIGR